MHRIFPIFLLFTLGACAQFGVPQLPAHWQPPEQATGEVFLVYHPHTVLGFGHTGLIVANDPPGTYLRFDQYASAEIVYGDRLRSGEAGFWEGVTSRLPSIFGFTREYVTRREGRTPAALLYVEELLLPLRNLDPAAVRMAAQSRYERAYTLERDGAPTYYWTANNCHHFTREVLRAGGAIPDRYFPKHMAEDIIAAETLGTVR